MVRPAGIEPALPAPEADALSPELRARMLESREELYHTLVIMSIPFTIHSHLAADRAFLLPKAKSLPP